VESQKFSSQDFPGKNKSSLQYPQLAQLATIVNPANKPTKVKWSLSWSRALENCGKKSCSLIRV